jgi:hypothetical protein
LDLSPLLMLQRRVAMSLSWKKWPEPRLRPRGWLRF